MKAVFLLALAGVIAFAVYKVVATYRTTEGSVAAKVWATAKGSATIAWSYIVAAGGIALAGADKLAEVLNLPDVQTFISAHLRADYVGAAFVLIAAITVVARVRRSLGWGS